MRETMREATAREAMRDGASRETVRDATRPATRWCVKRTQEHLPCSAPHSRVVRTRAPSHPQQSCGCRRGIMKLCDRRFGSSRQPARDHSGETVWEQPDHSAVRETMTRGWDATRDADGDAMLHGASRDHAMRHPASQLSPGGRVATRGCMRDATRPAARDGASRETMRAATRRNRARKIPMRDATHAMRDATRKIPMRDHAAANSCPRKNETSINNPAPIRTPTTINTW